MKRKAKSPKDIRRMKPSRVEREKVLIVTEGSKTEPDYFNRLILSLGLTTAKVRVSGNGGAAPISVFEEAVKILKHDDDYEKIYVVFDKDEHASYGEAIAKVLGLAARSTFRKKTVEVITSVPCFEVWFRLHISDSCKPYIGGGGGQTAAKALISDLKESQVNGKKIFAEYEKKSCAEFFNELTSYRQAAVERSARMLEQARTRGDIAHHENPSTRVHIVVKALEDLSRSS